MTTDARLLDSGGSADWLRADPWRVMRIQSVRHRLRALAEVGPAVSVFGSARTRPDHPTYQLGVRVGAALVAAGYAVITGGGPGAMEAANRGALEAGGTSVGLGIELPFEAGLNDTSTSASTSATSSPARRCSSSTPRASVLPGGFGTLDELFEAVTLVQTQKVTASRSCCSGPRYWGGLLDWLRGTAGKAAPSTCATRLLTVTDNVDEAVAAIVAAETPAGGLGGVRQPPAGPASPTPAATRPE